MEEGAKRGSADFRLLASDQIQVGIHWEIGIHDQACCLARPSACDMNTTTRKQHVHV